jgi:hypothetical protein
MKLARKHRGQMALYIYLLQNGLIAKKLLNQKFVVINCIFVNRFVRIMAKVSWYNWRIIAVNRSFLIVYRDRPVILSFKTCVAFVTSITNFYVKIYTSKTIVFDQPRFDTSNCQKRTVYSMLFKGKLFFKALSFNRILYVFEAGS